MNNQNIEFCAGISSDIKRQINIVIYPGGMQGFTHGNTYCSRQDYSELGSRIQLRIKMALFVRLNLDIHIFLQTERIHGQRAGKEKHLAGGWCRRLFDLGELASSAVSGCAMWIHYLSHYNRTRQYIGKNSLMYIILHIFFVHFYFFDYTNLPRSYQKTSPRIEERFPMSIGFTEIDL